MRPIPNLYEMGDVKGVTGHPSREGDDGDPKVTLSIKQAPEVGQDFSHSDWCKLMSRNRSISEILMFIRNFPLTTISFYLTTILI